MYALLTLLAAIAMLAGIFFLSDATMGVGLIGLACLFGIYARITQAQKQHAELVEILENLESVDTSQEQSQEEKAS